MNPLLIPSILTALLKLAEFILPRKVPPKHYSCHYLNNEKAWRFFNRSLNHWSRTTFKSYRKAAVAAWLDWELRGQSSDGTLPTNYPQPTTPNENANN